MYLFDINNQKAGIDVYVFDFKYLLPIGLVVAVELSQSEFLQFNLQLLVLPLQVHNHTVQEVDLMDIIRTQIRTGNPDHEKTQ